MTPQIQVTEAEVRDFFGEAKDGITRVNFPHSFAGKAKLAYVEFGDEEALKAGLDKHAEVCISKIQIAAFIDVSVSVAQGYSP